MQDKELQSHEICIGTRGKLTIFSIDILPDGTYRLQANLPDLRLTLDMSLHQFWALDRVVDDACELEGHVGTTDEYGDE